MKTSPYLVGISTQLYGVAKVSKGLVPPPFWISSAKIRRKPGRRNEVEWILKKIYWASYSMPERKTWIEYK
jgi:hypothetical protein